MPELQLAEAPFDGAQNRVVAAQLAAQKLGDRFARQVVFRGAQSPARDDQRHAVQRIAKRFGEQIAVVADNRLANDFDADLVQLSGQEERVGVGAVRSQHLRTDGNDFRFHLVDYPRSGKPRTSQSSVKSAVELARMARPDGSSARPTRPEPLSTTSA